MNRGELRTDFLARGFDDLASRANDILNQACAEVDEAFRWPYMENSGTGTAPVSVTDLRTIEAVTNETQGYPLAPVSYQALLENYGDLSASGAPEFYYIATPAGVPTVATYPTNSDTVGVQYWRSSPTLDDDTDEPLAPERYHGVYLAVASRMATVEAGGDASGWAAEAERGMQRMVAGLLIGQVQGPADYVRLTGSSEDC